MRLRCEYCENEPMELIHKVNDEELYKCPKCGCLIHVNRGRIVQKWKEGN